MTRNVVIAVSVGRRSSAHYKSAMARQRDVYIGPSHPKRHATDFSPLRCIHSYISSLPSVLDERYEHNLHWSRERPSRSHWRQSLE